MQTIYCKALCRSPGVPARHHSVQWQNCRPPNMAQASPSEAKGAWPPQRGREVSVLKRHVKYPAKTAIALWQPNSRALKDARLFSGFFYWGFVSGFTQTVASLCQQVAKIYGKGKKKGSVSQEKECKTAFDDPLPSQVHQCWPTSTTPNHIMYSETDESDKGLRSRMASWRWKIALPWSWSF